MTAVSVAGVDDTGSSKSGALDWIEWLFAGYSILFLTGGLTRLLSGGLPEELARQTSSPLVQLSGLLVYAGALAFIALRLPRYWPMMVRNLALFAPVLFAIASTYWSLDPEITLRRSIALFGTTALGLYVALRFDLREIATLLFVCLAVVVGASFVVAILLPGFGVHQASDASSGWHAGLWRGLYWHKNSLGPIACLQVVITLALWRSIPYAWPVKLGMVAVATIVVVRSGSAQAVLQLIVLTTLILAHHQFSRLSLMARIAIIAVAAMVAFPLLVFQDDVERFALGLLGRDSTLSSRTFIWHAAILGGMQQPYLGSGYEVGWFGGASLIAQQLYYYDLAQAHNGFLQIWLDLGFVGAALIGWVFVIYLVRTARVARVSHDAYMLALYILLFHLSANYISSQMMPYQSLYLVPRFDGLRAERTPHCRHARGRTAIGVPAVTAWIAVATTGDDAAAEQAPHATPDAALARPVRTIQAAIRRAVPGTAVLVREGLYVENLDVSPKGGLQSGRGFELLLLTAEQPLRIVGIDGFDADGRPRARVEGAEALSTIFVNGVSHVKLHNLEIAGRIGLGSERDEAPIKFIGGRDEVAPEDAAGWLEVAGCWIVGEGVDAIKAAKGQGLRVAGCRFDVVVPELMVDFVSILDSEVRDCEFDGQAKDGASAKGASGRIVWDGNVFRYSGYYCCAIGWRDPAITIGGISWSGWSVTCRRSAGTSSASTVSPGETCSPGPSSMR